MHNVFVYNNFSNILFIALMQWYNVVLGIGISKGIKKATIKGAAKKQGLRCQRMGAIEIISDYLNACVSQLAATGLRNADARGAATITRADCIEVN